MTADDEARPRRVLIVEDDDGLRNLILKGLRKAGYVTDGVATGADALEYLMANPGLALLLDQKLPDMTGSDIIKALHERGLRVPFIIMTGQGDERLAVEMMKLGAVDYMVKAFDTIDLLPGVFQRLFRELDNERLLAAAETDLRESEERYKTVVQSSPNAIVVHRDGIIMYANPAACRMFGAGSLSDLAGVPLLDRIHPDDRQTVLARRVRRASGAEVRPAMVELRYLKSDGMIFTGEVQGRAIIYDKLPARHITIRDITEHKLAEAYGAMRQEVLSILNGQEGDAPDSIQRVMVRLKERIGCNAVALRLQKGEDFPISPRKDLPTIFCEPKTRLSHMMPMAWCAGTKRATSGWNAPAAWSLPAKPTRPSRSSRRGEASGRAIPSPCSICHRIRIPAINRASNASITAMPPLPWFRCRTKSGLLACSSSMTGAKGISPSKRLNIWKESPRISARR